MVNFRMGHMTIDKIPELESVYMPLSFALPDIEGEDVRRLREWYWDEGMNEDLSLAKIHMPFQSYVLRVNGKNILIDSCNGNHKTRELPFCNRLDTPYLARLQEVGLSPRDIDLVLCTHLHFDHVGWNTQLADGKWVPTFPNARYLFTRTDYEFFESRYSDTLNRAAFEDSILPVVEHGLADLVETDHVIEHELGSGVWLQGAPGHTPGSCIVHAQCDDHKVIFSGDVFHHPLELVRPETRFFGDHDSPLAGRTRSELFEKYADSSTVFFPAHFSGVSGGRVCRHKGAYRYEYLDVPRPSWQSTAVAAHRR